MRDLAVQAANDSLGTAERAHVETETDKFITALENAFDQATFNGIDLIDTNAAAFLTFQVGADNGDNNRCRIDSLSGAALTVEDADLAFNTAAAASTSIGLIDTALTTSFIQTEQLWVLFKHRWSQRFVTWRTWLRTQQQRRLHHGHRLRS